MLSSIVRNYLLSRMHRIEAWMARPLEEQQKNFRVILKNARDTEWGRKFGYRSMASMNDFKRRIPLQDYETLQPFIHRMMQGEQNVLWNKPIHWFAKSSGTTSHKSKYIPLSSESIRFNHYRGGLDLLSAYCNDHPETNFLKGKGIVVGGSLQRNNENEKMSFGDLSAVLMQRLSRFSQRFRSPRLSIAIMNDWEPKLEAMARATLHENITNISGVPTWTLLLLKRIMELANTDDVLNVWKNFELYIHGGVSFLPYRKEFDKFFKKHPVHYREAYNASEGFFGFQLNERDDDLLLHVHNGVFYEFLPIQKINETEPETLLLHEVKTDEQYALIISTEGGLCRYKIGDTIRFTSIHPFKIQVTGRTKHYINAFGEEVIVDNAERALEEACRQTEAVVSDYTVAPIHLTSREKGAHEWFIEFSRNPVSFDQFLKLLDTSLQSLNSDYEAKRSHDLALLAPKIRVLPVGTFYRWLHAKGRIGGQHKVPRLSNDRTIAEEILALIQPQIQTDTSIPD
jgi:GH3 auxin-responsive promoter